MKVTHNSIRTIAFFEAFEGVLALVAASGLLMLVHRDLSEIVIRLMEHTHLNPAAHYPNIFITALDHLENMNFTLIALGVVAYSLVRFAEAFGLYHEMVWAEMLAALSSVIYIPIEIMEIFHRATLLSVGVLVMNVAVVTIAVGALLQRRRKREKLQLEGESSD
jgi:uncharacterized membrane protein (DUF2068 family)